MQSPTSIFRVRPSTKTDDEKNLTLLSRYMRSQFIRLFEQINHGHLIVSDPISKLEFGNPLSDLNCHITVSDINTYQRTILGGSNGSAGAYIEGLWSCDNLTNLIRILLRNRESLDNMETGLARFAQFTYQILHRFNRNSKSGSRKNISAHYDLGNHFFELFLDKRMMYSSALYEQNDNLQSASDRKLQRICDTLELSDQHHIAEIGSGWGGFACYAAATSGCRVTTITISEEQYAAVLNRVKQENLQELVNVKLLDYRDFDGQFDKVVSIEMIEAVGHQYLDGYFSKINQLLKPAGQALLQSIVIDDIRYEQALKEVDFIKRFIFPGSFIPCYSVIQDTAHDNHLQLNNLYDMGGSYAQTLRDWRQGFYDNITLADELGYDDEFKRMWEFYLCYCEGGFSEKSISVGQLLFNKIEK